MQAQEDFLPWPVLLSEIQALLDALQSQDPQRLRELLISLVSGYTPPPTEQLATQ
jgi:hypothetical protein